VGVGGGVVWGSWWRGEVSWRLWWMWRDGRERVCGERGRGSDARTLLARGYASVPKLNSNVRVEQASVAPDFGMFV
jgi:hypothetical protein